MDGWKVRRLDGWMDGWMNGWMDPDGELGLPIRLEGPNVRVRVKKLTACGWLALD